MPDQPADPSFPIDRDNLRARMKQLGLNQYSTAKKAGLGEDYVRDLLRGKVKQPSAIRLIKLAEALECSPGYLMGHAPPSDPGKFPDPVAPIPPELLEEQRQLSAQPDSAFVLNRCVAVEKSLQTKLLPAFPSADEADVSALIAGDERLGFRHSVHLSHALGLLGNRLRDDLLLLADIRNVAAHSNVSFADHAFRAQLLPLLQSFGADEKEEPTVLRSRFTLATSLLDIAITDGIQAAGKFVRELADELFVETANRSAKKT